MVTLRRHASTLRLQRNAETVYYGCDMEVLMPQVRKRHGRSTVNVVTTGVSRRASDENSAEPAMNLGLEDNVDPARRRRRDRRDSARDCTWTIAHIFADHRVGFVTLLTSKCQLSYAELCNRSQRPPPLPHDPQRNLGRSQRPSPRRRSPAWQSVHRYISTAVHTIVAIRSAWRAARRANGSEAVPPSGKARRQARHRDRSVSSRPHDTAAAATTQDRGPGTPRTQRDKAGHHR